MKSNTLTTAVFFGLKTSEVERNYFSAWAHGNAKLKCSCCLTFGGRRGLGCPDLYLPVLSGVALSPALIQEVGVGGGAVEGVESRVSVTQVHFHLLRQILHPPDYCFSALGEL